MHPNKIFHDATDRQNLTFARTRAFGALSINGDSGPLIAHVPFLVSDDGTHADLHLVRSNPIARTLSDPKQAVIAVSGPDGYISPDWYGLADQVPTWNYVAVHLRGRLKRLPDGALRDLLDRQSAVYEARLTPKPAWRPGKMQPDALSRMMRMIQPFRLRIDDVDGTWKLGQNKPADARQGASDAVTGGFGQQLADLAAAMGPVTDA